MDEEQRTIRFKIDPLPKLKSLPSGKHDQINIKYPLIPPYAYAHIYWDKANKELVYFVEEPELSQDEQYVLNMLEDGIKELINISFIAAKEGEKVIEYLEKNVQALLEELRIQLTEDSYLKIMYYIYRDFVGFGKIEPLLSDYYIEDIECNGSNLPVYIVHRKYRNIRTNIVFKDNDILRGFVERLAQKCGKYISYATPMLDGQLPDGSRANATYTQDISSLGPTFTLRKFTKSPWTPIHLIHLKTVSPQILAYLWLLVEYERNIMIIGATASGKCVVGDTPVYLPNGKIVKIKDFVEDKLKLGSKKDGEWDFFDGDGTEILTLDDNLKISKAKIKRFWRHSAPEKLYKITTRSGREITTTPEHPFFTFDDGKISKINAEDITNNERIAVPRKIPLYNEHNNCNFIDVIKDLEGIYVYDRFDEVKELIKLLKEKYNLSSDDGVANIFKVKPKTLNCWKHENSIPLSLYCKFLESLNKDIPTEIKLKGPKTSLVTRIPKVSPSLFRFLGLVLADGHLRKSYVEFHNTNKDLLNEFIDLGKELFGLDAKVEDYGYRVPRVRVYSTVVSKFLNKCFGVPYGNKARKIRAPSILFEQPEECIKEFISGIFDCEGYVGRSLEIGMSSDKFLDDLSTLFLRFGIVPRRIKRRVNISELDNLKMFYNTFNLRNGDKRGKLKRIIDSEFKSHTNVDLFPNCSGLIKEARLEMELNKTQFANKIGVNRNLIRMWEDGTRLPSRNTFNRFAECVKHLPNPGKEIYKLAKSDIFWDEIKDIEVCDNKEKYVYDLTVGNHNFLAGNIPMVVHNTTFLNGVAFFIPPQSRVVSIEDTRELSIFHSNWLPSVAREGVGLANLVGKKHGEVTLFDLLKESFRQRPDYVVVGEIRGKEAYVLFQGMSSGHPSSGTMHANSVDAMVRRLTTPPINLSGSLVESLDAVCVMISAKLGGKSVRKLKKVEEIMKVDDKSGRTQINVPYEWDAQTDSFAFKTQSYVFQKIQKEHGVPVATLEQELQIRTKLLIRMYQLGMFAPDQVSSIIKEYYKDPAAVRGRFRV